jgi:uncharacterized protein (DUF2252 family)
MCINNRYEIPFIIATPTTLKYLNPFMPIKNRITYPERRVWEPMPTLEERIAAGKKQRLITLREAHSAMPPAKDRKDPIKLLIDSCKGRVESLIPIRYGRMLHSSFAFLRGSAVVMAEDLSTIPNSGVIVQCCGDCHLMNFGGYATPERNQVFDINDFDETLPAPFEWDVKRLAASIIVAGRYRGFSEKENKKAALSAVKTYSEKIRELSQMHQLEIWYNHIDDTAIAKMFKTDPEFVKRVKQISAKAREHTHEFVFPKITELKDGRRRITDEPPLIYHPPNSEKLIETAHSFFDAYYLSLPDDRKSLLKRYRLEDIALKVVGVGSVGTRCLIGLFVSNDDDAIILQFKEGNSSVLEDHAGNSVYKNHGARIVNGQHLMQTVSDIFLGWTVNKDGVEFYVRQLRDMKASININDLTPPLLKDYASLCAWALAKSHAKAGQSPEIAGYIGKSNIFANAVADFAVKYADQTEKDFVLLQKAEKTKRIKVLYENGKE